MTAVDLDARERLAAAMAPKLREAYGSHLSRPGSDADWLSDADWAIDALLPVVQALVTEGAAKALRTAAGSFASEDEAIEVALGGASYVVAELRRDADQLDPS